MSNGNGHRWSKFWWQDWANDPALRKCSLAAQGLWIRLLCIMHEAEPRGHLLIDGDPPTAKELASITGATLREIGALLGELKRAKVYSQTMAGVVYSRRMVKDTAVSERGRETGKTGGHPGLLLGLVAKEDRSPRFQRKDHPRKVERIFERSGGRCHWCGDPLEFEAFHVDHVVAIRDGGGNEESNLVAACSDCNGKRALGWSPPLTPPTTPDATTPVASGVVGGVVSRVYLEAEVQSDSEVQAEERKEVLRKNPLSPNSVVGSRARGKTPPEMPPDNLVALFAEAEIEQPKPGNADPELVKAHVRRVAKACEMRVPYGAVRGRADQITAAESQQPTVVEDVGYRWAPAEPVRTVEQQLAELERMMRAEAAQSIAAE